jgi:hypothetical protein
MLNGISQNLTIPSGFFQSSGGVYSYASNVAEGIEAFTIWPDGRFTISLGAAALRGDVEQAYHPIRIIVGSRAFSGLVQPSEDTSNSFSGVHFDKSAYAPGDSIFISINQLYQPNHGNEVVYRATFGGSVFEPLRKSDRLLIGRKVAGPAGRYLLVVQAYERSKKRALAIERELAELEKQIKRLENRISDAPAKDLPLLYQNLAELITRRDAASDTLQSLETRVGKEIRAFALVQ